MADANGTRFHLLLTRADWERCFGPDGDPLRLHDDAASDPQGGSASPPESLAPLRWDAARDELSLNRRLLTFSAAPGDNAPLLAQRRGAAADRFGNIYWIDDSGIELKVQSSGSGIASHFWSAGDGLDCAPAGPHGDFAAAVALLPAPQRLSGMTVTTDHYLVVGTLEPAGLLVFDLYAGGPPEQLLWPAASGFAPFDLAARTAGGLCILDRDPDLDHPQRPARYWILDRQFAALTGTAPAAAGKRDFAPVVPPEGEESTSSWARWELSSAAAVTVPATAISIEALPDGTVLVLDAQAQSGFSPILAYRDGQLVATLTTAVMAQQIEPGNRAAFELAAHDFAFVPSPDASAQGPLGALYVVDVKGNQSFAFQVGYRDGDLPGQRSLVLEAIPEYLPMRLFGGKGLISDGTQAFYDFSSGWIPLIAQRRPRYNEQADIDTYTLDGGEPGCQWHRLLIDACIPPDSAIEVWSVAGDDEQYLARPEALLRLHEEPSPYLRTDGSELAFGEKRRSEDDGTWELLFQAARGRYLRLRLRLRGNARSTPRVRAVRAYAPRFSYLRDYLPAAYREADATTSFFERFLANFEGMFTTIEDRIAAAQMLFDPATAPAHSLDWLAQWFSVVLDPSWSEARRRAFITHAMDFFRWRGTTHGLSIALRLALDDCLDEHLFDEPTGEDTGPAGIRIIEDYRRRQTPGVTLGDPTQISASTRAAVLAAARWSPLSGGAALNQRYQTAIGSADKTLSFPLIDPGGAGSAAWSAFAARELGFVPSVARTDLELWRAFLQERYPDAAALSSAHEVFYAGFDDVPLPEDLPDADTVRDDWLKFLRKSASRRDCVPRALWHAFLARRYRSVVRLNTIYGTGWESFEQIALPWRLPAGAEPLDDWYQFESVVMAMQDTAHRFIVLLPVTGGEAGGSSGYQSRRELARRVIELEKPAHTSFDIKFYWALFQVGSARLGADTVLDVGSRAPQLVTKLVLGLGHLAESYLAPGFPQDSERRAILGRDSIGGGGQRWGMQ